MHIRKNYFFSIIILAVIARLVIIHIYGDSTIQMEWGEIFSAYERYGIFGREINGEIVPNLYMPPLYPMFLILLKFIYPFENNFPIFILYIQLLLSIISIFYINKILKDYFSENLSLIGTFIFAFLPLNIYCVGQSSSSCLQLFLLVLFFHSFLKFYKNENFKNSIIFSIYAGFLILIRGEFILTYILTLAYIFLLKKRFKFLIIAFLTSLIIISPYLVRNYTLTDKIIITKSSGFNLWKGNNLLSKVEGNDIIYNTNMKQEYKDLEIGNKYDINMDNIYKKEVIKNISLDPKRYLFLYIKKFSSFMFFDFDSSRPNYYNPLHIIPKIVLSALTLVGLILFIKEKNDEKNYFAYYYLYNIFLFSIFFILPRYSLMLLPSQIFLTCFLIKKLKPDI